MGVNRATVALSGLIVAGVFVWWFASSGLYPCDAVDGVQRCYLAEDAVEVTLARGASLIGAIVAALAGLTLIGRWITRWQ